MNVEKKFHVFGELVEVLISTKSTGGAFCVIRQTSRPGGGPPPHVHHREDEIFTVLEGEYEIFDGTKWNKLPKGETTFTLRDNVHTFRNCGTTVGCIQGIAIPGGLDEYLESISMMEMPRDLAQLTSVSDAVGIEFILPAQSQAVSA